MAKRCGRHCMGAQVSLQSQSPPGRGEGRSARVRRTGHRREPESASDLETGPFRNRTDSAASPRRNAHPATQRHPSVITIVTMHRSASLSARGKRTHIAFRRTRGRHSMRQRSGRHLRNHDAREHTIAEQRPLHASEVRFFCGNFLKMFFTFLTTLYK